MGVRVMVEGEMEVEVAVKKDVLFFPFFSSFLGIRGTMGIHPTRRPFKLGLLGSA